jgi:hypothetical protein
MGPDTRLADKLTVALGPLSDNRPVRRPTSTAKNREKEINRWRTGEKNGSQCIPATRALGTTVRREGTRLAWLLTVSPTSNPSNRLAGCEATPTFAPENKVHRSPNEMNRLAKTNEEQKMRKQVPATAATNGETLRRGDTRLVGPPTVSSTSASSNRLAGRKAKPTLVPESKY